MVSRRNYITITMMFLILFFMFQFTGVMRERLNEYGKNEYTLEAYTKLQNDSAFEVAKAASESATDSYAVYVGDAADETAKVAEWWCAYSKRELVCYDSLEDCAGDSAKQPELLLLDGSDIKTDAQADILTDLAGQGVNIVFMNMPDYSVLKDSQKLCSLLGIQYMIQESVSLTGMHLFSGFLLGGEAIYEAKEEEDQKRQDLELEMPWYILGTGTKTYMVGLLPEEFIESELPEYIAWQYGNMSETAKYNAVLPAVIWRNSVSKAKVFCVSGSYLSDIAGIGILDAMMAEIDLYEIYPVVNAQNFVVAGYPTFAAENESEMMQKYSQSAPDVYREIVWPSFSSLTIQTGAKLTCMMTPRYDYEDSSPLQGDDVPYYLRLLKEEHGEAGLYGDSVSDTPVAEKFSEDALFWQEYAPDYTFLSVYLKTAAQMQALEDSGVVPQVRSVVTGQEKNSAEPVISYASENVTMQRSISGGTEHTYMEDFRLKCIETALGYSNIVIDLKCIAFPQGEEDSWEQMVKKIAPNISTYWKNFQDFDATTIAESDQRIRRFLALDYHDQREGDVITLDIDNLEVEAWFLLRTNGEEIESTKGASFVEIEEGAYLIGAKREQIEITLKTRDGRYYQGGQR